MDYSTEYYKIVPSQEKWEGTAELYTQLVNGER